MDMDTSFDRSSLSRSRCSVSRWKELSRDPLFSPARTNPTYKDEKRRGCSDRASANPSPRSTLDRIDSSAGRTDSGAWAVPAASALARGIPAGRREATARVNSSTARRRPNPNPTPPFPFFWVSCTSNARSPRPSRSRTTASGDDPGNRPFVRRPRGSTAL